MLPKALILSLTLLFAATVIAQPNAAKPLRVAVLAPLYIDSVFRDTAFRGSMPLPKYMQPGLEFYQGVMLAVDSLQKDHVLAEVWVYDTRKAQQTAASLQAQMDAHHFTLIIASLGNAVEQQSFAAYAFNQNIPFISATYPNDAGVIGNPYFAIINPTLKTHVQSIYKHVRRSYTGTKVYYITRSGGTETKIRGYFDGMAVKSATLKYTLITLPDNFTAANLRPMVDSTVASIFICGSLNENFGVSVVRILNSIGFTNTVTAIGMPNWDGVKAFAQDDCKNVAVVYSTPYNFNRNAKPLADVNEVYQATYGTRPADMVFKGFEAMFHFAHLAAKLQNSLVYSVSDPSFKVSSDFNFQPVYLTPSSYAPDYLENKKLYFVKMLNGVIKGVD